MWKLSETFPDVPGAAVSTFGFGVLQNSGTKMIGEAVAILHRLAVVALAPLSDAVKDGRGSGATAAGGPTGGGGGMGDEAGSRTAAATALV